MRGQRIWAQDGLELRKGNQLWNWSNLSAPDLPAGVYFVRLSSPHGTAGSKLLVFH